MEQRSQDERRHTEKRAEESPFFMLIRKSEGCLGVRGALGGGREEHPKHQRRLEMSTGPPARGVGGSAHFALRTCVSDSFK